MLFLLFCCWWCVIKKIYQSMILTLVHCCQFQLFEFLYPVKQNFLSGSPKFIIGKKIFLQITTLLVSDACPFMIKLSDRFAKYSKVFKTDRTWQIV